jgi:hypothetical protein
MQQRRGTAAQWEAAQTALESTPILDAGEFGLETDTMMVKIGDGVNLWGDLAYINGQENLVVYNGTGSTIPKGSVVYISGAQGQNPSVSLADADSEATSSKTLGVTAKAITTGNTGPVAVFGVIVGIDTSSFTAGQALWLSSTAGALTGTKPTQPAHLVFVGYCIKSHANAGSIFVNTQNGYEIDELHDVLVDAKASITDNEVLAFDTSSQLWKNKTPSEAGIAALTGATFTGQIQSTHSSTWSSPAIIVGGAQGAMLLKDTDASQADALIGVNGGSFYVLGDTASDGTYDTTALSVNLTSGAASIAGTLTLQNGNLYTPSTGTAYLFNTNPTTLNIGGSATTINLGASTGNTQVNNNLVVSGNLTVQGDQIITNTATVEVEDTMIYIGTGNSANAKDIGVVGHFNNGTYQHTGLVRDASDSTWKLFSNVSTEPSNDVLDFTSAVYDDLKIGALDATSGTFSSTLGVTGATTLSSTLGVTGAVTLSSTLGVTGATTLSSTLGVTGATTLSSTLSVSGNISVNTNKFNITASTGATSVAGITSLTSGTASTAYSNGTLVVTGGVGISGATYTNGVISTTSQLASTVASGTAPLAITSPTVVTNLASNYAVRGAIYGTTAPTTASTSNMVKVYVSSTAPTDMGTGDVWIGF